MLQQWVTAFEMSELSPHDISAESDTHTVQPNLSAFLYNSSECLYKSSSAMTTEQKTVWPAWKCHWKKQVEGQGTW